MMNLVRNNQVFLALLAAIILLPLAGEKTVFFGFPLYFTEGAILIASLFFFLAQPRRPLSFPDTIILIGAGLFLGGALVSFLVNPFSLTGLGMLKSWFFFPALFGWLLWYELRTEERREIVLFTWLLVSLIVAVRGLLFIIGGDLTYDGRLASDFASPNFLAIILAPAPLLILYFFLSPVTTKYSSRWRSVFLSASLLLEVFVLFATHSYGVWLGVILALVLFFFGYGRGRFSWKGWVLTLFLFLGCLGGVIGVEYGSEKWQALFALDARSSLASRAMIWQSAVLIIRDHPLAGIGVGRFQAVYLEYQQYAPPYLEWAVPEPHNIFLAVFLATGLMGTLGFLLLVGRVIFFLLRAYFSAGMETERCFTLLSLALWILFLVYGMTDTPYFKNDLALLFFLLVALSLPQPSQKEKTLSREKA